MFGFFFFFSSEKRIRASRGFLLLFRFSQPVAGTGRERGFPSFPSFSFSVQTGRHFYSRQYGAPAPAAPVPQPAARALLGEKIKGSFSCSSSPLSQVGDRPEEGAATERPSRPPPEPGSRRVAGAAAGIAARAARSPHGPSPTHLRPCQDNFTSFSV